MSPHRKKHQTHFRLFIFLFFTARYCRISVRKNVLRKLLRIPYRRLKAGISVCWLCLFVAGVDRAQKPQDMRTRALATVSCIAAFRFSKWWRTNQNLTRHCDAAKPLSSLWEFFNIVKRYLSAFSHVLTTLAKRSDLNRFSKAAMFVTSFGAHFEACFLEEGQVFCVS